MPILADDYDDYDDYCRYNYDYLHEYKRNKERKTMKITKKFYVGSRTMIDGSRLDWPHTTLNGAIEHAKKLAEESDQDQIVVQIIRLVRRQKTPIIVEKI